jgi:CheY-like chemotaxis protein
MGKRILVIEDDSSISDCLTDVLGSFGFHVDLAINGRDGISRLLSMDPKPDLVLTDILMPVMDGNMFLAEKGRHPGISLIPVIVVTAGRANILGNDVVGLLRKPFDLNSLVTSIEKAINDRPRNSFNSEEARPGA